MEVAAAPTVVIHGRDALGVLSYFLVRHRDAPHADYLATVFHDALAEEDAFGGARWLVCVVAIPARVAAYLRGYFDTCGGDGFVDAAWAKAHARLFERSLRDVDPEADLHQGLPRAPWIPESWVEP